MGIADNNNNITFFHYGLAVGLFIGLMIRSVYMPCPNKADEKQIPHANFKPHVVKPGEAS